MPAIFFSSGIHMGQGLYLITADHLDPNSNNLELCFSLFFFFCPCGIIRACYIPLGYLSFLHGRSWFAKLYIYFAELVLMFIILIPHVELWKRRASCPEEESLYLVVSVFLCGTKTTCALNWGCPPLRWSLFYTCSYTVPCSQWIFCICTELVCALKWSTTAGMSIWCKGDLWGWLVQFWLKIQPWPSAC